MIALKNLWFTLKSLSIHPDRTFLYIINRLGDSQKNVLIALTLLVNWLQSFLLTKHDNILGFLLGSCFLLPVGYFIAIYILKLAASVLTFLVEKFGDSLDEFSAELIVVYSLLPISSCYTLLYIPIELLLHYSSSIFFTIAIIAAQGRLLFRGLISLTNLSWNKTAYVSIIFMCLPYLVIGLFAFFIAKIWN